MSPIKRLPAVLFSLLVSTAAFSQQPMNQEPYELLLSPSVTGGVTLPLGVFNDISDFGGGGELSCEMGNLLFPQTVLRLSLGFGVLSEQLTAVDAFALTSLTLMAGYTIPITGDIWIIPVLGGGYLGHMIAGSTSNLYLDPHLRVEVDGAFTIFDDFQIIAGPYTTVFFEQSNVAFFIGLNLGVRNNFHIFIEPQKPLMMPGTIQIRPGFESFSPNKDGIKDVMPLFPFVGGPFDRFEIRIKNAENKTFETIRGGNVIAKEYTWDGLSDSNKTADDGAYTAELVIIAGSDEKTVSSTPFIVDTTPPAVSVTISNRVFSPDKDGKADTSTISLASKNNEKIFDWKLTIIDPVGNVFLEHIGIPGKDTSFTWNGYSSAGELVQSSQQYTVKTEVQDKAGNKTTISDVIDTDILVQKFGNRFKVIIPSIVFEGYSDDFTVGKPEQVRKNREVLDRLSELFANYPGYSLIVEGYAVNVYTDSAARIKKENEEVLLPLSQKRAESIRTALIERGFIADNIIAVGKGNANPVVPYTDSENQWKNRRVEFILEK
ncbi:MAG: OmpA family protein [Spirochaetales bacterium]|nr:OmpA family protein [Spirochaetales bacterium]